MHEPASEPFGLTYRAADAGEAIVRAARTSAARTIVRRGNGGGLAGRTIAAPYQASQSEVAVELSGRGFPCRHAGLRSRGVLHPAIDPIARTDLLGCPVDALTMEQTVARVEDAIARRKTTQHVAINAAKVVRYQHDEALRAAVDGCELATADGQPVVWASRILGRPLPERVAGIDLMDRFLDAARQRGHGVFLLGARAEVLERAEQEILRRYPGVRIVGRHHGYFGAEGEAEVVDEVAAATPDILFVALETPAKELFLARNRERLGVPFVMGVVARSTCWPASVAARLAGCAVPGSNGSSGFRRTRADSPAATSWGTRSSSGSCCASELVRPQAAPRQRASTLTGAA